MREGAREQLDRIMRQNLPELLRLAVRLTGDHHRGEELIQETMVRAVRSWSQFRGQANPKTWLVSITINVFRDSLRSKSNQHQTQEQPLNQEIQSTIDGPEQQSMAMELEQEIGRQVSMLPPNQREVLVLITYEGMSVAEVGSILNMKSSNVYVTLHQARKTLKQQLQPFVVPEPDCKLKPEPKES